MVDSINHKIFGKLNFDQGWIKNIDLKIFGKNQKIQIVIDADEDADFEDAQIKSYEKFFEKIDRRVIDAENATFEFYQTVSPNIRDQYKGVEKINEIVPEISRKEDLYHLVFPKQILFPIIFDETKREAGFICDCSWEIEHGLGIKFENEIVTEVGFQDILL
ncbi:DUF6985 domain-containing protein [Sporolactobacillus putidus]|uniref:DUF6985 domain-containing protein n=1 Tax=Sporolactobacillus putidus TaxID=492735 RepID=A0A917S4W2_9BACL|nr:hypothetical protein [Sporolactobacillus putidus]GGL58308.1 hypothetical protein GCM10007968_22860 [Sporolactobacillus putidus]